MEYRVFRKITEENFQLNWKKSGMDHRTDIYFLLPPTIQAKQSGNLSFPYGLKLRDEKHLELKICHNRLSNGQEHWTKVLHRFHKSDPNDLQAIEHSLRQHRQDNVADQLKQSPIDVLCHVEKYLRGKVRRRDGTFESTGFSLRFQGRTDHRQIGEKLYFETFCFERSSLVELEKSVLDEIFQDKNLEENLPMSYPEFLWQQYEKCNQSV